ncbi:DAZP1 protein, partial [Polypterus senegalus]
MHLTCMSFLWRKLLIEMKVEQQQTFDYGDHLFGITLWVGVTLYGINEKVGMADEQWQQKPQRKRDIRSRLSDKGSKTHPDQNRLTNETLRNYFSQYGEVVDCVIMKDKNTNQSRGFGFVKFKDPNCVRTVLDSKPHSLDGRNIDPKPCTPRGMQTEKVRAKEGWQKTNKTDGSKSKKIFVGGIPHNCGEPELRDYFNRFGVVEVKRAEPRDSKPPNLQTSTSQWAPRGMLSTANGWTAQPPPGWQQGFGPQGMWIPPSQPMGFGFGAPPPPPDQFPPPGVPPPPTTPGATPMSFVPPPTPTQDISKSQTGQPEFSYNQYGYGQEMTGFSQSFPDPSQQVPPPYTTPSTQSSGGPQQGSSSFGRGQNHNVQGFHPYRR